MDVREYEHGEILGFKLKNGEIVIKADGGKAFSLTRCCVFQDSWEDWLTRKNAIAKLYFAGDRFLITL
jgi:hypothetical protein